MYILPPVYDYVFKSIMSDRIIAYNFFKSVIKKDLLLDNVIELNPNLLSEYKEDKNSELDLKFHVEKDIIVNLEMQREYYSELWKRFQYYNNKIYTNQLHSGEDYTSLKRVINISFFEDILIKTDDEPIHHFILYDPNTNIYYQNSNEYIFLEISKRDFCKDK